jgi:hypothetical protein
MELLRFEEVSDENGTRNNVELFGYKVGTQSNGVKIPISAYGGTWWSWGGKYWTWHIGKVWIDVFDPVDTLKSTLEPQITEIKYAVKSFFSILSGYTGMEERCGDGEWVDASSAEIVDGDEAYYVCASFNNGRHIPVPILADWVPDFNKLQKLAIRLALVLNPSARMAVQEAEEYPQ